MDHSPGGIVLAAAVAMMAPALCQADVGPSQFAFAAIKEQGHNRVVSWREGSCDPRQHRLGRENCQGVKILFEGDLASVTTKELIDNQRDDPDCRFYQYSVVDGCPEAGFTMYRLWIRDDYQGWTEFGNRSTVIEQDTDLCGDPCAPDPDADTDADADANEEQSTSTEDGGAGCTTTGGSSPSLGIMLLCAVLLMRRNRAKRTRQ